MSSPNKLVTILGPTAVGKTKFAAILADKFNGEIISADSRQVYKRMDIGTGKDYDDYIVGDRKINVHLMDVIEPSEEFNLFLFKEYFGKSFIDILSRKAHPFLVGGTGMYLSSVLQNYKLDKAEFDGHREKELEKMDVESLRKILMSVNPKLHNSTDTQLKDRIIKAIIVGEAEDNKQILQNDIEHLVIGIHAEREIIKSRIRERLKKRLKTGMVDEAQRLLDSGITHEKLRFFGLEYKFLSMYLKGELNYNDMQQKLASAIINFSKRQMTWFRKMEKEGININWMTNDDIDSAYELINAFLK